MCENDVMKLLGREAGVEPLACMIGRPLVDAIPNVEAHGRARLHRARQSEATTSSTVVRLGQWLAPRSGPVLLYLGQGSVLYSYNVTLHTGSSPVHWVESRPRWGLTSVQNRIVHFTNAETAMQSVRPLPPSERTAAQPRVSRGIAITYLTQSP